MKDSVHWANRLYRRRKRLCVNGKGPWPCAYRMTSDAYFICLVDGIPVTASADFISDAVFDYEMDYFLDECAPEAYPFPLYPEITFREYVWRHSKKAVSRDVAFSVPCRFEWELNPLRWRKPVLADEVWDEDIPF